MSSKEGGSFNVDRMRKAVTWPAVVWIITDVLYRLAALVSSSAGAELGANLYPIATTLGLVLAVWAGVWVKEAKGTYQEAIVGGIIVGLACGVPAVLLFGVGSAAFAINITIFSLAAAWAGWGLASRASH